MPGRGVPHRSGPAGVGPLRAPDLVGYSPTLPGPTALVLDNFNRADGAAGANWTQFYTFGTGLAITSQQIVASVQSGYWNATQFGPDCEAYVTFISWAASGQLLLGLRASGQGTSAYNYYAAKAFQTGGMGVYAGVGGVETQIINDSTYTLQPRDKLGLRVNGTTVELWVQPTGGYWTLRGSTTDSTVTGAGWLLVYGESSATFDDVAAGPMPAAAVTTPLTLTASSTPTIVLANQSTKQGVLSEAAVALSLRLTAKQAAASETATTTVAKRAAKAVAASETATTAMQRQAGKTLAVSEAAAATLPRLAGKILTAAESAATAIARRAAKTLASTETAATAIQKQVGKLGVVSETATVTLGRIKAALLLLTASTTASTTVQKQAGKQLAATETASTATTRRTGKTASISETATGAVRSLVGKIVASSETATVTVTRIKTVQLVLAAASTATVTLRKQATKTLAATETATVVARRSMGRILAVASVATTVAAKRVTKTVVAASTASAGLVAAFIGAAVHALRAFYGYVAGVGDGGEPPQTADTAVISWTATTGLYPSPGSYPSPTTYPQPTALIVEAPSSAAVAATGDTATVSVGASGGVSL